MWGSPEDNKRGEMLEELVIDECLEIFNIGNEHTFRRHLGGRLAEKIIDVTFGLGVIDSVLNWKVSNTMLSDHLPIEFNLGKALHNKAEVLNYKRADWTAFMAGSYDMDISDVWSQARLE
jgi:hypothetical protein